MNKNIGTIYWLQCKVENTSRLKVGYTGQSFTDYLAWLQRRIPFELKVLATRSGDIDEEREFHRVHKDYRAAWGGLEWFEDTPWFRRDAEKFLRLSAIEVCAQPAHGE